MKKSYVILLCLVGFATYASAFTKLSPERHYFLGVNGSLGYSTLLNNIGDNLRPGPGVTPSVGFDFRGYYNGFIYGFGAEVRYAFNSNTVQESFLKLSMKDTELEDFVMKADVTDCKDFVHTLDLNIPLQFGYEHHKFYFMAGVKFGLNLMGSTNTLSKLTTTGDYERFVDPFSNMPNHQFYAGNEVSSLKYGFQWNFRTLGHLEIGGRVDDVFKYTGFDVPKSGRRLYVAAFIDCDLLNIHKPIAQGPALNYMQASSDEELRFYVTPAVVCDEMKDASIRNLMVGVKFTALFELPQGKKCVMCEQLKLQRKRGKTRIERED